MIKKLKFLKYYNSGIFIIIGLSIGLTIFSTWCGLGLTYDSHAYLAAAESLEENKLTNHNEAPYTFHAPLFPVALSLLGENPSRSFLILNKFVCLFTLLLLFIISKNYFKSKLISLMLFITISFNVGFQMINFFLWTESIFLLIFVAHNYFLLKFLSGERKVDYWLLICTAFLMGITKNTGWFIILTTSGILLLYTKRSNFKISGIYALLGSIGFSIWNIYIIIFSNGVQMYRNNEFLTGFQLNTYNYTDILSQWFLPGLVPYAFRLLFLIVLAIFFIKILIKKNAPIQIKIFFTQFLAYLVIMIVAVKVDKDEIERLLSIIAPWLMMVVFMTIEWKLENVGLALRRYIFGLLILWLFYIGFRGINNCIRWHSRNCTTENTSIIQSENH